MESPTRLPPSPSKALNPVSPERMNQQTIPASPSLPADLLTLHHKNHRGVSEVQAKVAFLNGLSRGGSPASASSNNAAVLRANLGREEAESALVTAQEELAEAQDRERRISERLESLLEELHGTKERQGHERSIFEKEIRKARKEAFRAGSTLVKLQEELKHAKSEAKALKDEVAAERESKDKAKQEAFERAYALAGLTEELEVLKEKFRALETENHSSTLEVRAHEIRKEDFGRLSLAEGDLAFLNTPRRPKRAAAGSVRSPAPEREEDIAEATPPKRPRLSECGPITETEQPAPEVTPVEVDEDGLEEIKEELIFERRRRVAAEDMVHFLNIECQFERCSCRIAESQGRRYIYDADYYNNFQKPQIEAEEKARALQQASVKQPSPQPASTPEASPPPPPVHRSPIHKSPVHRSPVHQATTPQVASPHTSHHEEPETSRTPLAAPPVPAHEHAPPLVKSEPTDPPKMEMPAEPLVTFSPETGTFMTFPSPLRDNVRPLRLDQFDTPDLPEPQPDFHSSHIGSSASPDQHVQSFTPSGEPAPIPASAPAPAPAPAAAPAPASTVRTRATPADDTSDHSSARARLSQEARPSSRVGRDAHGYRQPLSAPKRDPNQPINNTKRVPLRHEAQSQRTSHPGVPDTPIDREQALAQIRARRGRAHSKQRSVSANEAGRAARASAGSNPTPAQGPRRVPNPNLRPNSRSENDIGERRDLSAPVRMFRR
jgi:actin-related protein